jgi:SAM-dependent methyltransferase
MQVLRKIYYALPPKLRFLARKIFYTPIDLLNPKSDAPPQGLIYTGSGDFIKQGNAWRRFFIEFADLQKDHHFLDIGSGIGRIALPLTTYLTGKYFGFEAMKDGVNWCQKNISSKYPNFTFEYVPLYNDLYNSTGINAAEYLFDYAANFFDVACSISVFTHMLPAEVDNYIKQTQQVLKPGGRLVATFFILDEESESLQKANDSNFTFDHHFEHYALMSKKVKAANVAFQRTYLNQLFDQYGLEIIHEIKGAWCGREKQHEVGFQDVLVLRNK